MPYSNGFKINVNKLNADEKILILAEINHPFLGVPIRIVNDNQTLISLGNSFVPMEFSIKRQDDVQGELPSVMFSVQNVGRSLVRWIDSTGGGRDAKLKIMMVRRSTPDVVEESLTLGIQRVTVTTEVVNFSLVVQNDLIRRSMKFVYDKQRAPGLF